MNNINKYKLRLTKLNRKRKRNYKLTGGNIASVFGRIGSALGTGVKKIGSATANLGKGFAKRVSSPFKHAIIRRRIMSNPDIFSNMLSKSTDIKKTFKIRKLFGEAYIKGLTKSASGSRGLIRNTPPSQEALAKLQEFSTGKMSVELGLPNKKLTNAIQKALPKANYKKAIFDAHNEKNKYITELRKKGLGFFESRKAADRIFKEKKKLLLTKRGIDSLKITRNALRDKRKRQWLITRGLTLRKYRKTKKPLIESINTLEKQGKSQEYKLSTMKTSVNSRADIAKTLKDRNLRQKLLGSHKAEHQFLKQQKQAEKNLARGATSAVKTQVNMLNTKDKLKYIGELRDKQKSFTGKMGKVLKKDVSRVKRNLYSGTDLQTARKQVTDIDKKKFTYDKIKKQYQSTGIKGKMNRRAKQELRATMAKMRKGKLNSSSVEKRMMEIGERQKLYKNEKTKIQQLKDKIRIEPNKANKEQLKMALLARQSARRKISKSSTKRKFGIFGKKTGKITHNNKMKSYSDRISKAEQAEKTAKFDRTNTLPTPSNKTPITPNKTPITLNNTPTIPNKIPTTLDIPPTNFGKPSTTFGSPTLSLPISHEISV